MTSTFFRPFWTLPPVSKCQIFVDPPCKHVSDIYAFPQHAMKFSIFSEISFWKPLTEQKKEYFDGLFNNLNHLLHFLSPKV